LKPTFCTNIISVSCSYAAKAGIGHRRPREQLDREGLTVPGREGGIRPHPCINIEHNARLAVARLIRELDLDVGPPVAEVLELFRELEKLKPSKRFADKRSQRLGELLGLGDEYWTVNHVNDISPRPTYSPYQAQNWDTCREMRVQLLKATGLTKKNPAGKARLKADEDAQPSHKVASNVSTSRTN
jgi:hypothetical protein